ncbi:MAG: BLUF domain-containing protein [Polaromonas sp.]|uniref:BLUF domain-containing protein n=1 Tax=Polaromonas sp. TaxID=1869339 RepID=UPI0025E629F6|nr:BLUF domain-containing protein [Polaromonas sp.]MBI2727467.1 BLUF domain-containing protein [Polaromonas sp.]
MTITTPLHEVLYVSTLKPGEPISIVADIAARARVFNESHNITGLLIFDGMRFCQQLEGERKPVMALLERICRDTRHVNVEVLHHAPLGQRRFRRFSLGYTTVDDIDVLEKLEQLDGQAAMDLFVSLLSTLDLDA